MKEKIKDKIRWWIERFIYWLRLRRVESFRADAYAGGDVERYVAARLQFWKRYER